jgi:hypothetical protein
MLIELTSFQLALQQILALAVAMLDELSSFLLALQQTLALAGFWMNFNTTPNVNEPIQPYINGRGSAVNRTLVAPIPVKG